MRKLPFLLALVALPLTPACTEAYNAADAGTGGTPDGGTTDPNAGCHMAYESLPNPSLPNRDEAIRRGDYAAKAAFTEQIRAAFLDRIVTGMGLGGQITTTVRPGGYLLGTNPSFQSTLQGSDDSPCDRFAAAAGFVFEQESVLVWRFAVGDVGYGQVGFPDGTLDDKVAQEFFVHAASVNDALRGGYSAVADTMVFINLRDATGKPYSMTDDATLFASLQQAVGSYPAGTAKWIGGGVTNAHLVANTWRTNADGADYLSKLSDVPQVVENLKTLRAEFETRVVKK